MANPLSTPDHQSRIGIWLPLALMVVICLAGSRINYLLFHTMAEMISIVIAFTAMIVASQSRSFTQNNFVVYLAMVIGWCAGLDFIHTLVFKGMNLLQTDSANPATQLWIASRALQALAMLAAPVMLTRPVRLSTVNIVLGLICLVILGLIVTGYFPAMYVEGSGLTTIKIVSEYMVIAVLIATLVVYTAYRARMPVNLFKYLCLALLASIASEFAFTQYVSVYAPANLIGHLLKICSYWFIYLGLVDTALSQPFSLLTRASTTFDAIPDPTLVISADGKILQANRAASKLADTRVLELIEQSSHTYFHDSSLAPDVCPVCKRMAAGEHTFTEIIRFSAREQIHEYRLTPFIREGRHQTYVQVIRDITDREKAISKIQDLTYLYEMLSATNRAIVHCQSESELFSSLFEAMVKGNAFPLLFVATTDDGRIPLRIVHAHGFSIDHLSDLANALQNPDSPINAVIQSLKVGTIENLLLPPKEDQDDWVEYLRSQGITNRAFMPLSDGSTLTGVVVLYSRESSIFDEQQLKLLQQMSSDISFALNSMTTKRLRAEAEEIAVLSDKRFSEIFHGTPAPLQIVEVSSKRVLMINNAMLQWLGYRLEEITTETEWLDHVCSTTAEKQLLMDAWSKAVHHALNDHETHSSPEITLRAKDGSTRVAQGALKVVGEEVIIAWTDLTELRKKDQELLESARHFRNMIEQSVAGIYVRRGAKFIYTNPRYCEMTGWSNDELLNHEVLEFVSSDRNNLEMIQQAWAKLEQGQSSVTYTVKMKHKNGQDIELELHAKTIDWDGSPAHIVLVDDITERKAQQDKIRDYVVRLEASMKGTLSAVANMVEMRDPYTAGHERRVGLIARDIAFEMGWTEERAKAMEMIGLVHDIGKIAIPAEILVKPSRLSPIEMELVKGHVNAGYEILKNIPFPIPVADIIRQHHERVDGSGYPQGLKGADIMPEAKILAVADVIESMATHRPYRPALGLDIALAEVMNGAGTKFDPEVADSVKRLIIEKNYQLPK